MSDGTQNISEGVQASVPPQLVTPFWLVPWEFAVHALVGTSIFAIIAAAAVLLDLAVRKLGAYAGTQRLNPLANNRGTGHGCLHHFVLISVVGAGLTLP